MAESVEIEVLEDGMEAILKQITPQTTIDVVIAARKAEGVAENILGEVIKNAVSATQKANRPVGDIVTVKGTSKSTSSTQN